MKRSYVIYVCPTCDEQNQFAGFCDTCNVRLVLVRCVPIEAIREFVGEATPLGNVGDFVKSLSDWSSPTHSG